MLELVCPAGTPASMRAAVGSGADAVYCGLRDATNARNFPGPNACAASSCHPEGGREDRPRLAGLLKRAAAGLGQEEENKTEE